MTRTQFLGLFAIPLLPKIDLEQECHVFNVKKIKERIAFLRKYPLTEAECFRIIEKEPWMRNYQRLVKNNIETK